MLWCWNFATPVHFARFAHSSLSVVQILLYVQYVSAFFLSCDREVSEPVCFVHFMCREIREMNATHHDMKCVASMTLHCSAAYSCKLRIPL